MLVIYPASLLLDNHSKEPIHDCLAVIGMIQMVLLDLTDTPLISLDEILFTDRTSYVQEGIRYVGAAVVTLDCIIWSHALPRGTSTQEAKLIALIHALRWAKGKSVTIYNSRYAFATVHVHRTIYKERGLLISAWKDIKNKKVILALLEVIWIPKDLREVNKQVEPIHPSLLFPELVHCNGHQKGNSLEAKGNWVMDEVAREAALKPVGPLHILLLNSILIYLPH